VYQESVRSGKADHAGQPKSRLIMHKLFVSTEDDTIFNVSRAQIPSLDTVQCLKKHARDGHKIDSI